MDDSYYVAISNQVFIVQKEAVWIFDKAEPF